MPLIASDCLSQVFILNLDRSVLALMIGGFASTVLRPEACAFILLPCRDSNALFFYRQDRRTRRLLGTRRYERLTLWLQLHRNRLKRAARRRWRWLRSGCRSQLSDRESQWQSQRESYRSSGSSEGGASHGASVLAANQGAP